MKVSDTEIQALDLTNPNGLVRLIVEYFCAKPPFVLNECESGLMQRYFDSARTCGLNFEQLNELLLLLRQNRISKAFFAFFFLPEDGIFDGHTEAEALALEGLRRGVIKFRALAMLRYGNFVFARRTLSKMDSEVKIAAALGVFAAGTRERGSIFSDRPQKVLDITPITRDCTWLTGQLSVRTIDRELEAAQADAQSATDPDRSKWLNEFIARLWDMKARQREIERVALNNIGVYLTWDYLDVYVATSMRNTWEFEETFDFVDSKVLKDVVRRLNLRFFDPTQCKCANSRDKGLVEGLMLNRAVCTIYMAQEGDTLGKDSELAVTLAQGKPVIAYVPDYKPTEYADKIRSRPPEFFENRLKILDAEGVLDDPECVARFARIDPQSDHTLRRFSEQLQEHRQRQKFSLARELDEEFKRQLPEFPMVRTLLAEAEVVNFDRRATLLRGAHPLSMQVDMRTGTANGVIVVRSPEECAQLMCELLTNNLDLEIVREQKDNINFTLLRERRSGCAFRAVTHNEQLTNSFWNLFK